MNLSFDRHLFTALSIIDIVTCMTINGFLFMHRERATARDVVRSQVDCTLAIYNVRFLVTAAVQIVVRRHVDVTESMKMLRVYHA